MKMTFRDHVLSKSNERAEFVKKIAELTLTTDATVSRWLSGEFLPSAKRQQVIADHLGTTPEVLWPTKSEDDE